MNKQIILKSRPVGLPDFSSFEFREVEIPVIDDGELLLKAQYISVDPYIRGRMSNTKSYVAPFELGKPISGGVVAEVIESKDSTFRKGESVLGIFPWQQIFKVNSKEVTKIDGKIASLGHYLGILGMPGLTAYFGLLDIGKPQMGETVVVSGAAGAVGMLVGQIAKIQGCKVIGIAGDQEKIDFLLNELHFDVAINYHTETNIAKSIIAACHNGVDVYFDNVGGSISDAVCAQINVGGRIVICGQISLYNETSLPVGPRIQPILLKRSALMQGFIINRYSSRFPEGIKQLSEWLKEGKLINKETITIGFDNLPKAFLGLFEGKNTGKALVKVD